MLTSTLVTLVDLTPRVAIGWTHLGSVVRRRRREDDVDVEQVVDADLLGLGDEHGRDAGRLTLVLQEVLLEVAGMVVVAGMKCHRVVTS